MARHPEHVTEYPLAWPQGWPRSNPPGRLAWGHFRSMAPGKAVESLYEELRLLGAEHVVISANVERRLDGQPYATSQNPKDVGVAVYFVYDGKPLAMAQDAYGQWFINVRSIALAVKALRAIERHGGGYMMARSFAGFAALPPPEGDQGPRRPWRDVLELSDVQGLASHLMRPIVESQWKTLSRKYHPDSPGGSHDRMTELNQAVADARAELDAK